MERFLCLATCWDDEFLVQLKKQSLHKQVYELYGALHTSVVGSGRPSHRLPQVSREGAQHHIQKCHSIGIKFDYLLNASCLGNQEFDSDGQKKILALLSWLQKCEVDSVTVSIPYLVEAIKRYFPHMYVNVSTIAHVNSVPKARFWEAMGADRITLDFMMNRDFEFLKNVRSAVKCGLEVIANDLCLYGCPLRYYHYNIVAHTSQEAGAGSQKRSQLASSYPALKCGLIKLTDPTEIIKSRWIRPEDVKLYRDLGIDFIKVVERTRPIDFLLMCAKAYSEGSYEGNLLDIVPLLVSRLENGAFARNLPIYVDNKSLKGFLNYFLSNNCRGNCHECDYCEGFARRSTRVVNKAHLDKLIEQQSKEASEATAWETINS